ncbi:MAG: hypothetical protein CBD18_03295 [Opitutales bacterium TMED158]|nr:MAG: hypothetical protein CBD18_03295 [Opitutales bacterium TMED158]
MESWAFLNAGLGKFNSEDGYSYSCSYDGFVASQTAVFATETNLWAVLYWPHLHSLAYVSLA